MNDFSDIENDLQKLRPAQPSPVLFERIEEALAKDRSASVAADAGWNWRRLLETPYNWGFALAAAAVLVLFAAISVERRQEHGENATQVSSAPEMSQSVPATPKERGLARTEPMNKFIPAGATQVVYNTRDEGLHFTNASPQPVRRLRYHSRQTWQWRNPTTGASLRVSYPSEEVVLIPVSGQ
jgi:HAMP domain-containing protein